MRTNQMFAYTRPDGVVGYGFQIHPQPYITHHSIAWPDIACQRFTDATLANNKISFAECGLPIVNGPIVEAGDGVGELVTDVVEESPVAPVAQTNRPPAKPAVPTTPVVANQAGASEQSPATAEATLTAATPSEPETPPVQVAAEPTVTKVQPAPDVNVEAASAPEAEEKNAFPGSDAEFLEVVDSTVIVNGESIDGVTSETSAAATTPTAIAQESPTVADPVFAKQPEPAEEPLRSIVDAAKANAVLVEPTASVRPAIRELLEKPYQQAVSANVTVERTLLHLVQKAKTASDEDIIRFLNSKGVEVTAEMVRVQRDEADRLEAQSGL